MPQASKPLPPQQGQLAGRSENLARGLVEAPYAQQQKASTASEQSVQEPLIEEFAVAKRALDLPNEPAGPCALEPAEVCVSSGLAAPLGVTSHPLDAATASHARPLFRARTEDGH